MAESNARPPATARTILVVAAGLIAVACVGIALWLLLADDGEENHTAGEPVHSVSDTPVGAPTTAPATSPAATPTASPAETAIPPSTTPPGATPGGTRTPAVPADGRVDTRTISFAEARGLPKVFAVAESAAQDADVLAGVFAGSPNKRPAEPTPATDFVRNVVVTVTVDAGCLDPEGARLFATGNRLRLDVRLPDRSPPPECLAPYIRLARFEVPRASLPQRPVLDGKSPSTPDANSRP
ncbi:hypothetical protein B4N89_43510 [Embleya scabrispora]|uniref:Uncharacterized protein n=1 Tax=Embleya scabrispora TaxID=159449 RepID=A0A1T3NL35_9ACTN|nr:hypothetical protein [Embleya scabrispora]OPC77385.1 hypothetical protein B4N89_43510 [Embleya scabrispora]